MDSFVRSFVGKVHNHVVTSKEPPTDFVVSQLVTTLHKNTPDDVFAKALSALCHDLERTMPYIVACNGLARIIEVAAVVAPHDFPMQAIQDLCRIVSLFDARALRLALLSAQRRVPATLSSLLDWHLACGSASTLLSFVHVVTENVELLTHVQTLPATLTLFCRARGDVLHNAHFCSLALATFVRLIGSSGERFLSFIERGGEALFEAAAKMRVTGALTSTALLDAVSALILTLDDAAIDAIPCSFGVAEALLYDAGDEAPLLTLLTLLRAPAIRHMLLPDGLFVSGFLHKLVLRFAQLSEAERLEALEYAVSAARPCPKEVQQSFYERLFELNDEPTLALRTLVFTLGLSTAEIIPHFERTVQTLRECAVAARDLTSAHDDVTDAFLERASAVQAADAQLVCHFRNVLQEPELLYPGLMLDGSVGTDEVLFHLVGLVATRTPAPNAEGDLEVDALIRSFLNEHVDKVRSSSVCWGLHVYCGDLNQRYCLGQRPLPRAPLADEFLTRCPLSLDVIHFPVVASDGHTYEFEKLVQLHLFRADKSAPFLSPLTRAELRPCVTFNRALRNNEIQLYKFFLSHRSRRRAISGGAADAD